MNIRLVSFCLSVLMLASASTVSAESINVAVASNFAPTARALAESWKSETGNLAMISTGSSGKHYAQIVNGAPFDVFLSADQKLPTLLEAGGHTQDGNRFTYALGRLVLWSRDDQRIDGQAEILTDRDFRFLAIANPRLAPYGQAAEALLEKLGIGDSLEGQLVMGDNVNQAFQFAWSGHAELALVAWSQIIRLPPEQQGSHWKVPAGQYPEIIQQAVLISDIPAARAFTEYLKSEPARKIILAYGYDIPHVD